jgi:hypothetical protein
MFSYLFIPGLVDDLRTRHHLVDLIGGHFAAPLHRRVVGAERGHEKVAVCRAAAAIASSVKTFLSPSAGGKYTSCFA